MFIKLAVRVIVHWSYTFSKLAVRVIMDCSYTFSKLPVSHTGLELYI